MKIYTLTGLIFCTSLFGEIIDDFFASSISFQRTVTNYNPSTGAGTHWSEMEADSKVINGHRQMAFSPRSNGTITIKSSRSKLNLRSEGAAGELLIYNQTPFEEPVLDLSTQFAEATPTLVLDFIESPSVDFEILFVVQSLFERILIRTTVPANTNTFSYQLQAFEIPDSFTGSDITSIRLFITFPADTEFTLDYYGLDFDDSSSELTSADISTFPESESLENAVQISIPQSEFGNHYNLFSTNDLSLPKEDWSLVETKNGNGFAINWTYNLNALKENRFFIIQANPEH